MPTRVALITGSTRGIGLGIACALADDGYAIALNGVRAPEEVVDAIDRIAGRGVSTAYFRADISCAEDRARLVAQVQEDLGQIDVLVNNAGVAPLRREDMLDADAESFERLIATNLQGPYFLTQLVARTMVGCADERPAPGRAIVFVTSVSAELASTNRGDYCIAKAGLSMAARLWAVRLAEHGVMVYEVRPGIVETDMTSAVRAKYDAMIDAGLLLEPRWGTPADIGRAVATLVRGDLPYATGAIVTLDGGMTVGRL